MKRLDFLRPAIFLLLSRPVNALASDDAHSRFALLWKLPLDGLLLARVRQNPLRQKLFERGFI